MSLNDLKDHSTDAAQYVADKARGAAETASSTASSIADKIKSGELGESARNAAGQLRGRAKDVVERTSEEGEKVARQAALYVREDPLAAVAVASLIGLVLGYILARR